MENKPFSKGLEGVIADESRICKIDGSNGRLYYRGYTIEDLAAHCSYEEVAFLLLYEELPNRVELDDFSTRMRSSRELARLPIILELLVSSITRTINGGASTPLRTAE